MGKPDVLVKRYMRNPARFADAFNYAVYDGKQVIRPENLVPSDITELTAAREKPGGKTVIKQKLRDVMKQWVIKEDGKAVYAILGIENQFFVHYAEVIQCGLYDFLNYDAQVREIRKEMERKEKQEKENAADSTPADRTDHYSWAERMSGFRKNDKLKPVLTLVIYLGDGVWDGPRTLHEMLDTEDKTLLSCIPDYRFNLCAGWLDGDPIIGTVFAEHARGSEVISFAYNPQWLELHPGLVLDPSLGLHTGRQYPPNGAATFGFLADIAPDRWGRKLMERRERLDAEAENRHPKKLQESDYMLGVHDGGRAGGLRLQEPISGNFLSDREDMAAPPIAHLRALQQASLALEKNARDENTWLRIVLAPGSSLGGARPKADVLNTDGNIWIAKFPPTQDDYNVDAWEMVAHDLAGKCGISVPVATLENYSDYGSTYLSKRYDRFQLGKNGRKIWPGQDRNRQNGSGLSRSRALCTFRVISSVAKRSRPRNVSVPCRLYSEMITGIQQNIILLYIQSKTLNTD